MTPWTVAYQAPLSMGFSRQEYWSGLPFPSPGDLPDPGIEPGTTALETDALLSEPSGKPKCPVGPDRQEASNPEPEEPRDKNRIRSQLERDFDVGAEVYEVLASSEEVNVERELRQMTMRCFL